MISLSDFQTGIGTAGNNTLDTEQLISDSRTALVDTISSLQGSDGGVIAGLEVHELLILDNTMSKWVGKIVHLLASLFNSASMQHHEVWASQFHSSQ